MTKKILMFAQRVKYINSLLAFLQEPTTCKLNIKKLVIAYKIEETSVQRPVVLN